MHLITYYTHLIWTKKARIANNYGFAIGFRFCIRYYCDNNYYVHVILICHDP